MSKIKLTGIGVMLIILISIFFSTTYSQTKVDTTNKEPFVLNLANTTWSGVDSDGDFYEYTFLEGGKVSYKTNTSRRDTVQFNDDEDVWFQNDSTFVILLGNTSVQKGIINNNSIKGTAWNVNGRRWTWEGKKK